MRFIVQRNTRKPSLYTPKFLSIDICQSLIIQTTHYQLNNTNSYKETFKTDVMLCISVS